MERQKQISSYELGSLFFLLQQSSTFWLLPHFLVKENGTLGLISIVSGVIVAFLIIGFCGSLFRHIEKGGIIAAIISALVALIICAIKAKKAGGFANAVKESFLKVFLITLVIAIALLILF